MLFISVHEPGEVITAQYMVQRRLDGGKGGMDP